MSERDLELEMADLGKKRYRSKVNKAKEQGLETTTPVGQKLLRNAIPQLTESIKRWMEEAAGKPGRRHRALSFLEVLPPKVTAALTAQAVLDSISQQRKIMSAATRLGRILEDEVNYRFLRDNHKPMWNQMNRTLNRTTNHKNKSLFIRRTVEYHGIEFPKWLPKDRGSVGLTCIELMRQATGLIDIITKNTTGRRSTTYIKATEELMLWMREAHKYGEVLRPVLMPMTEKPIDWSSAYGGGYIGDAFVGQRSLVKTRDRGYLEELSAAPMPSVYRAINAIQRTPMAVNEPVLAVMRHCWENGLSVGGLPTLKDIPLPTKPLDIKDNEDSRGMWKKQAASIYFENERQQSKRLQVSKVLWLADRFAKKPMYYPHQMCFRARGYPLPYFLQPQGPDWSRSVLRFYEGEPVDEAAEAWAAVNVANGWGMDKESYSDRTQWVLDNQDMIIDVAKDPLGCMEWTKADEPWKFLASCFDWYDMLKTGKSHRSHLPICSDATTQGLQIYALLLRDEKAGYETNCTKRDKPGDVYQAVADKTLERLRASSDPYASKWIEFGITRGTTKRQSMTLTYGSTFFSCRSYTAEWFYGELRDKNRPNPFGKETYKPCNYLAQLIWDSINDVVGSARSCMDWLRDIATICMDNNSPIRWVTPLGFIVKQDYKRQGKDLVKTMVNGVVRQHRILFDKEELDRRKNINALPPNLIHSLDGIGGLLGETVNLALDQGIKSFSMIHDSYATHSKYTGLLGGCVREASINIFEEKLLDNFRNQILSSLPSSVSLPPTPPKGSLRVSELRDSDYYFS
jgi:DNA-directed RNA polymerase